MQKPAPEAAAVATEWQLATAADNKQHCSSITWVSYQYTRSAFSAHLGELPALVITPKNHHSQQLPIWLANGIMCVVCFECVCGFRASECFAQFNMLIPNAHTNTHTKCQQPPTSPERARNKPLGPKPVRPKYMYNLCHAIPYVSC